jgi:hypothetical protein
LNGRVTGRLPLTGPVDVVDISHHASVRRSKSQAKSHAASPDAPPP